jgi:predicted transcriptional regulator of viral defense system
MESLAKYGVIPIDYASLRASYPSLKALEDKICDLGKKSTIIRLKRGLYIVSPAVSKREVSIELIANHLYGPSYVSKESALRFYGLIPERVYNTVSMTIKRRQRFRNNFGQYDYISCPAGYYSIGIRQVIREDYAFMIASPEKALCDQIVYTPRLQLRSVKALLAYLEEDIRFDMDEFFKMDVSIFEQCLGISKKKDTIDLVIKLLKQ